MTKVLDRTDPTLAARALALHDVGKSYGGVRAVHDVTLTVQRGERVGVIGPNGAGKTTLFKLISGDVRPSSGRVMFEGRDITSTPVHKRARLGLGRTFQITNLMSSLTLRENMVLAAGARTLGPDLGRVEEVAARFRLTPLLHRRIADLAYGQQRRVELALALCGGATTLLLDEPAAGLGPDDRIVMQETIQALPPDLTILLIEHDIDLTLGLVQRVVCLHDGELVADESSAQIRHNEVVRRIYLGADTSPEVS